MINKNNNCKKYKKVRRIICKQEISFKTVEVKLGSQINKNKLAE